MRASALAFVVLVAMVAAAAVPASARDTTRFPTYRVGKGAQSTSGGGIVAGADFKTQSAIVIWRRRWSSLTLYLLPRSNVTCKSLLVDIQRPGPFVQVLVSRATNIKVDVAATGLDVGFVMVPLGKQQPPDIAGLTKGASLTVTHVDSFPGGIWHGVFRVPQRTYADGHVYGYKGGFAARFCQVDH